MRSARALKSWDDELEQLLDRAADVLGEGWPHSVAGPAGLTHPAAHEAVDVPRQLCQRPGSSGTRRHTQHLAP